MPQDNDANFFKKKLAELDQTLPPEVTWNQEQGWQQLQPVLPIKRRRKVIWYQVAAAVAILVSSLFLLNPKIKKATVNSTQTAVVVKQNIKSPLPVLPEIKPVERTPVKNLVAMVPDKVRKIKNLKNPIPREPALINKTSPRVSAQDLQLVPNTRIVANIQEVPLAILPETIPPVPTPIKITVVLGGRTNRQLAVYAANEAPKVNRKKSSRLKVQVNIPNKAQPDDSALAASANLLPSRSAISAKIDL